MTPKWLKDGVRALWKGQEVVIVFVPTSTDAVRIPLVEVRGADGEERLVNQRSLKRITPPATGEIGEQP